MPNSAFRSRTSRKIASRPTRLALVTILQDGVEHAVEARSVIGGFGLGAYFGKSSVRRDKIVIEGCEVDLLFTRWHGLVLRQTRADVVLDANAQRPSTRLLPRLDLQKANLGNLTQILALGFAEP